MKGLCYYVVSSWCRMTCKLYTNSSLMWMQCYIKIISIQHLIVFFSWLKSGCSWLTMLEGSPLRPKVLNKLSCSWHRILPVLMVFENNGRFSWLLFSRRNWMLPFQKSDTNKNQMTVTCRANRTMWMNNAFLY